MLIIGSLANNNALTNKAEILSYISNKILEFLNMSVTMDKIPSNNTDGIIRKYIPDFLIMS